MKILIVDDSKQKAEETADCIRGHANSPKIYFASNARDAITILMIESFDVVFLDILLPIEPGAAPSEDSSVWMLREMDRRLLGRIMPVVIGTTQYSDSFAKVDEVFREYLWSVVLVSSSNIGWRKQIGYAIKYLGGKVDTFSLRAEGTYFDAIDFAIVTALRLPEFIELVNAFGGGSKVVLRETNESWLRCDLLIDGTRRIQIVAACADEMGMCAMASLTTKIILACRPKKLLLVGIMGGNRNHVGIADLVMVEETWDSKAGKVTERGFVADLKSQKCDFKLLNAARSILTEAKLYEISQAWPGVKPNSTPKLHSGSVACSPAVISDDKFFTEMEKHKRKILGVEMEAFGCYDAARRTGDFAPAVICLKAVCDLGDKKKGDSYQRYCAFIAAQATKVLISDVNFAKT